MGGRFLSERSWLPLRWWARLYGHALPELLLATEPQRTKHVKTAIRELMASVGFNLYVFLQLVLFGFVIWLAFQRGWLSTPLGILAALPFGLAWGTAIDFVGKFWVFRSMVARTIRWELNRDGILVCLECGYDLRGQVEPRCPECGAVSTKAFVHIAQRRSDSTEN